MARLYRIYSTVHVGPVVILQRGHHLEKVKAPEYCPFYRRYHKIFANRFGMDAERNSGGVRREKPRCKANQPGETFPVIALGR